MEAEDYERALFEGPWMVGDHYIVSEEWRPNFEPAHAQVNNLRVWVRLPNLSIEYFDAAILRLIGDRIGRTIRIDHTTLTGTRGNYARICVEVNLQEPLLSKYRLHRRVRRIEYEGLHVICYHCGCYGHEKGSCSLLHKQHQEAEGDKQSVEGGDFNIQGESETAIFRPEISEEFGPWMLAKKRIRKQRPQSVQVPRSQNHTPKERETEGSRFYGLQGNNEIPNSKKVMKGDVPIPEDPHRVIPEPVGDTNSATAKKVPTQVNDRSVPLQSVSKILQRVAGGTKVPKSGKKPEINRGTSSSTSGTSNESSKNASTADKNLHSGKSSKNGKPNDSMEVDKSTADRGEFNAVAGELRGLGCGVGDVIGDPTLTNHMES
ncbi:hypothetical protein LINPERHAP2_LOCUS24873 [Linum perenne]